MDTTEGIKSKPSGFSDIGFSAQAEYAEIDDMQTCSIDYETRAEYEQRPLPEVPLTQLKQTKYPPSVESDQPDEPYKTTTILNQNYIPSVSQIYDNRPDAEDNLQPPSYPAPPSPMTPEYSINTNSLNNDPYKTFTMIPQKSTVDQGDESVTSCFCNKRNIIILLGLVIVLLVVISAGVPLALYYERQTGNLPFSSTIPPATPTTTPTATTSTLPTTSPSTTPTTIPPTIPTTAPPTTTAPSTTPTTAPSTIPTTAPSSTPTTIPPTTTAPSTTTTTALPTTTVPPANPPTTQPNMSYPRDCTVGYRCNSCYCLSERCPANGDTYRVSEFGMTEYCSLPCFTLYSKTYDSGRIHRGCVKTKPQWAEASKTPGCRVIDDYTVCFCCGDLCNTDDMRKYMTVTPDQCYLTRN